jgi:outer membrane protein assembly factor BamA
LKARFIAIGIAALAAIYCQAQVAPPDAKPVSAGQPASRAEAIERERAAKQATLTPEELPKPERMVRQFQDQRILEKLAEGYKGWRAVAGGLATGSGFAVGTEYTNHNLGNGYMELRATGQISTRLWQKYAGTLLFPQSFGKRLISAVNLTHHNYNSLDYYGPGNYSTRGGRTNYRLEDTTWQGVAIARPEKRLRAGAMMGYVWTNVGPGRRADISSTERVYSEAQAPGLNLQSNFFRYGMLAQYDRRDNPLGPKTGGNYVVQWLRYQDQTRSLYSFNRYDIDMQEYVGLFNNTRRLAFRAHATLTDPVGTNAVPFYMRPTVGGSDDVRGYRQYRFNGSNSLILNAEYRWEIFSGMDGALFYDAGKVMQRGGHLGLSQMRGSAGFGLRANIRNQTFLRFDVGFSREGFMIWFKFNDAFNSQRFGTGAFQPLY